MTVEDRLTDEQRKLVEDNHNLIYSFAYTNNIYIEDFYDLLAIGLCNAAKAFNKDKGEFSTIAYECMKNEYITYLDEVKKKSVVPDSLVLSYDTPVVCEDSVDNDCYIECIPDYQPCSDMMYAIMQAEFVKTLSNKERIVFYNLSNGATQKEIGDVLGCAQPSVHYHIINLREKLMNYLNK